MEISFFTDNYMMYLEGILYTISLTFGSLIIGAAFALSLAILKDSDIKIIKYSSRGFIFYFRGTPLLVQIYLIYSGLAQFSIINETFLWFAFSNAYFCVFLALIFNTAAYGAEIIHGGIKATSPGEIEVAKSFGFSKKQYFFKIIMPSVVRRILPAYTNETIFLMQATALASVVGVVELTKVASILNSRFYAPFEAFITAGVFYLALSYVIFLVARFLEKKFNRHLAVVV